MTHASNMYISASLLALLQTHALFLLLYQGKYPGMILVTEVHRECKSRTYYAIGAVAM